MKKSFVVCLLILLTTGLLFSAGAKESTVAEDSDKPVEMEWLISKNSVEVDPNATVVRQIEDRFNVKLSSWNINPPDSMRISTFALPVGDA